MRLIALLLMCGCAVWLWCAAIVSVQGGRESRPGGAIRSRRTVAALAAATGIALVITVVGVPLAAAGFVLASFRGAGCAAAFRGTARPAAGSFAVPARLCLALVVLSVLSLLGYGIGATLTAVVTVWDSADSRRGGLQETGGTVRMTHRRRPT